jgi:CRP/FNR family transcriptional regulator, cyclic AMP receptor protein
MRKKDDTDHKGIYLLNTPQQDTLNPSSPQYNHCMLALRQSAFFVGLSTQVQRDILGFFRYERVRTLEANIALDDTEQRFYVIVSGRAKVSVYHPETGREHILFLLAPGDGYDIISLLDGKPHDAVATALDDMEVLTAPLEKVREWLFRHPDFNKTFLPYIGNQMRQLAAQVEDLALYDTETRLARLILRHLTASSPVHGLNLINDLSKEALASMIGSVRVVVTQHVQRWKKQNSSWVFSAISPFSILKNSVYVNWRTSP